MFFTINLHFFTSNQTSTYGKLNLHRSHKQYLFCLLTSLEMQKTLEQTKMYHTFSYFVWKETNHKPLKVAAAKKFFSSAYVIGTTCFDERFHEKLTLLWSVMMLLSLKPVFERSPHFMRYFHNNNMMLIPKFQNKADYVS